MEAYASPEPSDNRETQPPKNYLDMKPSVSIIVALIGLIASVVSSIIASKSTAHETAQTTARDTAQNTANAAILKFEDQVSGGTIDANMNRTNQVGRDYNVTKQGVGLFRIQFTQPFASPPVAVVATHKDNVPTLARIDAHDGGSILVSIHQVNNDALVDGEFSFYVLEAIPTKP